MFIMVCYGIIWWYGMVWYGMVPYLKRADEAKEAVSGIIVC